MNYELPKLTEPLIEIEPDTNIAGLISSYYQNGKDIYTFSDSTELWIEVVVVSSDEAGNFYKRLIVQDINDDKPGRGLSVLIDLRSYYTKYNLSSRIFINVAGLSISGDNGSFSVGFLQGDRIAEIPESLLDRFIVRSGTQINLETELTQASELSEENINTRIRIADAQFYLEDVGKTFAGESFDNYNAIRPLVLCNGEAPLFLSTSVYADFKHQLLPESTFQLEGLLIREYNDQLAIVLNDPRDLKIQSSKRCDENYLNCENSRNHQYDEIYSSTDQEVLFYENFEGIQNTRDIEKEGWTNINLEFGNSRFARRSSHNNTFVRISAYGSEESTVHVWLISPEIDLGQTQEAFLVFDTRASFYEGQLLTAWVSANFKGRVEEAEWHRLPARISEGGPDGSGEKFISSGELLLDCLQGKIRIGFKYLGGDPGPSTNYDIDNILIRAKSQ